MTEKWKSRPHDVFELLWPLKSCVLLRECETFDKNVVFSRTAQNDPQIEKCEARRVLKRGFRWAFGEPAGRAWTGKGWPKTLFFLKENEGFLKPYEDDARKTKKRHKKVWVCVVDKMAPQSDFKTVIFEAPTQSESVFY